MKITFNTVVKIYLSIVMLLSLAFIADRLSETTSKPIIVKDQIYSNTFVVKKGIFFPARIEKL